MKKNVKRILALLLCLTMCFGVASPALAAYYAAGTVVKDDGTDEIAAGTVVDEDSEDEYFAPSTAGSVIETDGEAVNVEEPTREIDPSIPVTPADAFPEPRVVEITAESLESGVPAVSSPLTRNIKGGSGSVLCWKDSSGYTIKELTPSIGYLLNSTAYSVGLNPAQTSIEYNDTIATVTEQVIKGKVKITKHTDKGETGVETPEDGAKFEVFLSNSGSYENTRAAERDIITTDGDGMLLAENLNCGVYFVTEIAAPAP